MRSEDIKEVAKSLEDNNGEKKSEGKMKGNCGRAREKGSSMCEKDEE